MIEGRLAAILSEWDRTPYRPGKQKKGMGADCVRFVCAVLDEISGRPPVAIETLPQDAAMHTREGAIRTMRLIRRLYWPNDAVRDGSLEPGDVIVMGPADGGPGHALIVGPQPNTIWHATHLRVQRTGLRILTDGRARVFRVYRMRCRSSWVA